MRLVNNCKSLELCIRPYVYIKRWCVITLTSRLRWWDDDREQNVNVYLKTKSISPNGLREWLRPCVMVMMKNIDNHVIILFGSSYVGFFSAKKPLQVSLHYSLISMLPRDTHLEHFICCLPGPSFLLISLNRLLFPLECLFLYWLLPVGLWCQSRCRWRTRVLFEK